MKKILIVAPLKVEAFIEAFPAIHALKKSNPKGENHILIIDTLIPFIKYLDCELQLHTFGQSQYNLFQLHKFAVNKNEIFNVDIAVDFEGSFLSSYMMYAFRSTVRIAATDNQWNCARLFHTKTKVLTSNYLELLSTSLAIPLDEIKGFGRGPGNIKKEERFIALFFDNAESIKQEAEKLSFLFSDFDLFSIGIYIHEINVGDAHLLEEIYNKYFKSYKIGFRIGVENWDLPKTLLMSSIIISNITWICLLSSYFGLPSIFWGLNSKSSNINGFTIQPNSLLLQDFNNITFNNRQMTLHEAVDLIFEIFKIEKEKALHEEGQNKAENKFTLL